MTVTGETLSITSQRDGSAHRVVAVGELDLATVDLLERALGEIDDGAQTVVLDLSGLSFIDSTGLRLVLDLNDRYGGEADRLRVVAGSPAVERLLDIVGLRDQLPLVTDEGGLAR
jgi:anti-sigma B factor antagonist